MEHKCLGKPALVLQKVLSTTSHTGNKVPKYASVVPWNIESTALRTNAGVWATNSFGDDRQLTVNDPIQEQKLALTKNNKETMGHSLPINKMASHNKQSQ